MNFFATISYKTLKQTPCQWLYNPIIKITAIGYVIEMLEIPPTILSYPINPNNPILSTILSKNNCYRKCHRNVGNTSHNPILSYQS